MKAKTIYTAAIVLLSVISSCFDHNKYKSGNQSVPIDDNSPTAILLQMTMQNASDSVLLNFRGKGLHTSKLIQKFYALNKNYPVWTSGMEPNHFANELIRLLSRAQYYGLDTSFYQYTDLKELRHSLENRKDSNINKKVLEFELLMTHNCFKLMSHLHVGLLNADTALYGEHLVKYPRNFPDKLMNFINNDKLGDGILDLQPKSYEYRRLQKGLELFLNQMTLSDDSFQMPDPAIDSVLAYKKAKEILIAYNYINIDAYKNEYIASTFDKMKKIGPSPEIADDFYPIITNQDSLFFMSLKEFQKDNGLSTDGKIGLNTQKALQINNRDRFEQIAINLERLKWEKPRPSKYVYVNVPAYKLRVIDSFTIVKTFNLGVGTPWTETPMLNSKIEYFTTNPEWYVPYSISTKELLPKAKEDSTYLERHNYRIYDKERVPVSYVDWSEVERSNFSYFFQQAAGAGNALGKIKFYFENPYIVYIHDTPDKSKFNKDIRAYSHGCMRIQDPAEFAKTLLNLEPNNRADSVDFWIDSGSRKIVNFLEPIQLYVRYITCEADSKSQITFYQDIYNKDKKLKKQFFAQKDF